MKLAWVRGGSRLSGGERQRVVIARAILKDAPILLLDEATASIDPDNEHEIRIALARLCAGKTVIIVAHRPNTVANVDHIIAMESGRIEICQARGIKKLIWQN
ncbi:ATP-binding cassette domain-containing protein [Ochrobactrum pecoris]|nr:ATP-binding cassette domain-containing protein [Brucella pecoris]